MVSEQRRLPAVHLAATVVFPHDVVSLQVAPGDPLERLLEGAEGEPEVAAVFPRNGRRGFRRSEDVHGVCLMCRVVQHMRMPAGGLQAVLQGTGRARVRAVESRDGRRIVEVEPLPDDPPEDPSTDAAVVTVLGLLSDYLPRDSAYPEDLEQILRMNARGPGRFADLVAAYLHLPLAAKREVAVSLDVARRLDVLADAIRAELDRSVVESDVQDRVREQMEQRQREHYLRQQMRAIRRELGEEDDESETAVLLAKLERAGLPREAKDVARREIRRLSSTPASSAEHQVIRSYVGWLLDLPWRKRTRDRLDLAAARRALDEDHTGLEDVKERILEHLAVRTLKRDGRGPILCLVGPPGVGKTSLGRAVARALGRKFVRMSVGGLRDEAEIKGHRRTYVGAMPGKILQLLRRAGANNPVLQIDEIDKMGADARGDPASALLEALDPELNGDFRDHYLEVGFDLSRVLFLVTANLLEPIPHALRDRLEVLRLSGYTREEKLRIARRHLLPRAADEHGLPDKHVRFSPAGLAELLDGYAREAGLRELQRQIHRVCRKAATRLAEGRAAPLHVGPQRVRELLGPRRYAPPLAGRAPQVGVATGLAWTSHGGQLLAVEACRMPGRGELVVTGRLGEVMRESARAALSWIRTHAGELDLDPATFRRFDLHVHMPDGATPKDGPSAGVTVATCLVSLFSNRPVRHDLAMTGEITLSGRVLEVGGIREKLLAAHAAGIVRVLVPQGNLDEVAELPAEVRGALDVVGTTDVMENVCEALLASAARPTVQDVAHPTTAIAAMYSVPAPPSQL